MIRSMTAFGAARVDLEAGTLMLELRSVNSRYLDLHFRLPDELRHAETPLRELLTANLGRGKVEVRASFTRTSGAELTRLDPTWLQHLATQLEDARRILPEIEAPRLSELFNWPGQRSNEALDPQVWTAACLQAGKEALAQLQEGREREGRRLADLMLACADDVAPILDTVNEHMPQLLADHREKLSNKLREAMESAFPAGFTHISGAELTERLAQETNLFALRIDVAEELGRLNSHLDELRHLLGGKGSQSTQTAQPKSGKKPQTPARPAGSAGKRLDFLFQEMNREANTLGSKAGSMDVTRAAMDLKLLIEQMREQAQNIE